MFTGHASIVASALDANMVKPVARIAEAHFAWNGEKKFRSPLTLDQ